MKGQKTICAAVLAMMTITAEAKDSASNAIEARFSGTQIDFNATHAGKTQVSISGPGGFQLQRNSDTGSASVSLYEYGNLADGVYTYQVVSASGDMQVFQDTMDNGRGENNRIVARKGVTKTGHFRVVNGQIKQYDNTSESAIDVK